MYKVIYNVCHNIVDGSEVPVGSKWSRCEDWAWRACPDDKAECYGSESACAPNSLRVSVEASANVCPFIQPWRCLTGTS